MGIVLESELLSFLSQVTGVVQFCIVQLKHFYKISSFLSSADLERPSMPLSPARALYSGLSG